MNGKVLEDLLQKQLDIKKTVLIVDYVKMMRRNLSHILSNAGYTVLGAKNGIEALNILQKRNVHLVITDVEMPSMNGLELLQSIRSSAETAKIPVIMCTGTKKKKDLVCAMRLGIQGFFIKPITPTDVRKKVEEILGRTNEESRQAPEQESNEESEARGGRGYYFPETDGRGMRMISEKKLEEGMVLARDLHTLGRTLLLRRKTVLNATHIDNIKRAEGSNRPAAIYIIDGSGGESV